MTLRHMVIFIEVANCANMSMAANRLYISQSTVSLAIAEIEKKYNTKVFERMTKGLCLTEAGGILLDYAQKIVTLHKEMDSVMAGMKGGRIRIGSTLIAHSCILNDLMIAYHLENPEVTTRFVVDKPNMLERELLQGELDVVLSEEALINTNLECFPVMEDEFFLICSREHPFSQRTEILTEEFQNEPFLFREKENSTRKMLENAFRQKGIQMKTYQVCYNVDSLKEKVMKNEGVSVLSGRLVKEEARRGKIHICPIADLPVKRKFYVIHYKNKHLFPSIRSFIGLCREFQEREEG